MGKRAKKAIDGLVEIKGTGELGTALAMYMIRYLDMDKVNRKTFYAILAASAILFETDHEETFTRERIMGYLDDMGMK
jgi:hypothetical protein